MPLADLLSPELAIGAVTALVAAFISGFAGFGLNLTMTPVLALLFSPVEAVPIVTVLGVVNLLRMVDGTWRHVEAREVLTLGLGACVTVPLGALLLIDADPVAMRRAISGLVALFTLILLLGWRYRGPRSLATHAGTGLVSGLINGSAGIGGPPVVLYQLARGGDPTVGRANLVGFFGLLTVATLVTFLANDLLDEAVALRSAVLAPFVAFGTWTGMKAFSPRNIPLYRRVALGFLLCVSVMILLLG